MFLPPNVTAICQPMDQGVLKTLKTNSRRKLVSSLLQEANGRQVDVIESGLLDKLLEENATEDEEGSKSTEESILPLVQCIPGGEEATLEEVEDWLKEGNEYAIIDKEIIALVKNDSNDIDVEEPADKLPKISHEDAVKALEVAMAYVEH